MQLPDPRIRPTLSVEDAAGLLDISRASAYQGVKSGEIPCIRVGRRILVPTAARSSCWVRHERLTAVGGAGCRPCRFGPPDRDDLRPPRTWDDRCAPTTPPSTWPRGRRRITDDIGLPRRVRTGAPREGGVMSADLLLYVDDDASERLWGLFDFHRIVCHWPVAAEYLRLCQRHGFDVNGEYDDGRGSRSLGSPAPTTNLLPLRGAGCERRWPHDRRQSPDREPWRPARLRVRRRQRRCQKQAGHIGMHGGVQKKGDWVHCYQQPSPLERRGGSQPPVGTGRISGHNKTEEWRQRNGCDRRTNEAGAGGWPVVPTQWLRPKR